MTSYGEERERERERAALATSSGIQSGDDGGIGQDQSTDEAAPRVAGDEGIDGHPPSSAPTHAEERFLRFRLTYIDTVQSSPLDLPPPPSSEDDSTPFIPARRVPFTSSKSAAFTIDRVPEIRIFGATEAGQRCCVHVHGVLPYVYVEYEGAVSPDAIHSYIRRLARAINECMAASLGRKDPTKSCFVAFIVPVKAVPFYGFHVGYRYFLKIYVLDPKFMTRLSTHLRSGAILRKQFIVYEAHIPYLLQFMLDANLYGCGWVDISKAKFREPVEESASVGSSADFSDLSGDQAEQPMAAQTDANVVIQPRRKPKIYTRSTIPSSMLYENAEAAPAKVSHSELEFDIHVSWILNRHLISERNLHADFTEYLHRPIPDDYKFVHSVRELWEDEKRRRQQNGLDGPMEVSENSAGDLLLGGLTAGTRSAPSGAGTGVVDPNDPDARMFGIGLQPPWKSFDENAVHFAALLEKDRAGYAAQHPGKPEPAFETFARKEKKGGWMEKIRTSFQSVEALFEETMERDEASGNPFGAWGITGGVMGGSAAGAGLAAGKREETTEPEVDPKYLARLRTKEGQAQLLRAENEDAMLDARVDNEFGADEVNAHSDEEELAAEEDKRVAEERAKDMACKPGVSRQEALESVEAGRELSEEMQAAGMYQDQGAPMGAQQPGLPRRSTTAESEDRASSAADEQAPVTGGTGQPSAVTEDRGEEEEDLALYRDVAMEELDPDLALLDQLMPLDQPELEPDMSREAQNMDLRSSPPLFAPNGLPAMTPASRLIDGDPDATSRAGTPAAGAVPASTPPLSEASKQRELLRQAGFGDLSQLDLDSDALLDDSSPEKATVDRKPGLLQPEFVPEDRPVPSQSRWASGVYSPQKRKHADISPQKISPFKLRATPAPVSNAAATSATITSQGNAKRPSPAKKNYFSPAKSKLRNAVVNPNFVAESRAKKNREEQMIGFHAIGEHGRTVLQGMLQPQVKVKAKAKSSEPNIANAFEQNGAKQHQAEEGGHASKKARRSYSFSSSESEAEAGAWAHGNGDARMRIILSSAEAAQPPIAQMESPESSSSAESEQAPESLADLPTQLAGSPSPVSPDTSPPVPDSLDLPDSQGLVFGGEQVAGSTSRTDAVAEVDQHIDLDLSNSPMRSFQVDSRHVPFPDQAKGAETALRPELPRNVRFASILSERDGGNSSDADTDEEGEGGGWEEDEEDSRDDAELSASPETMIRPDGEESNRFEEALAPAEASEAAVPDQAAVITLTPSSSWPSSHKPSSSSQAPHSERRTYRLSMSAPTLYEILLDLDNHRLPHKIYQDAYWSNPTDLPAYTFEWAGRRYLHRSDADRFLPEFEHAAHSKDRLSIPAAPVCFKRWQYAVPLPKRSAILGWKEGQEETTTVQAPKVDRKGKALVMDIQWVQKSQVQGPTQANAYGAKYAQVKASNAVVKEKEHMSSLAIELHINTRGELLPDPAQDPIQAIFYCLQNEDDHIPDNGRKEGTHCGLIALNYETNNHDGIELKFRRMGLSRYTIDIVEDELELVNALVDRVREWDPEIFTGFDVLKDSWGYFVERVDEVFPGFDIVAELSRVRSQSTGKRGSKNDDRWGYSKGSTLKITGRHVLPVWRLLKSDINLCMYSFENVVFHLLRQRVPRFSHSTLTSWYLSGYPHLVRRVLQYRMLRAQLVIELLEEAEIVSRNAEFARVFGVDFHSVLTRGSQFKVESVMFKISKPENFMLPSPSREDVGRQNAAECMPLILEPESGFYSSPVLVFDFQSLYPSVMIAYNLCYSTCLGRIKEFMGTNRLGTASLAIQKGTLTLLKDHITISPNGMMFLKPGIRRSLISKMLTEILDTRVMIKKSMKLVKADDNALSKLLNARQLGLKFIANVTYGYTSATFSGRMPCVEVADAIVQTGRETLERAKHTIESRPDWGAIVRYGDTDSLFVHLPGKTKDEAFKIGNDIADTITKLNPKPVKLKFEKVYLPCFLLAKKRYVGFKYESQKDVEPVFDAKGIETVRRDGFPAMQKMLETCIKLMFRSADLSSVKLYVQQQFSRIMQNRASAQDFIYAKEVKMGSYSDKGTPPPGAVVTARRMLTDPRTEALYGERVPYVISKGLDGPQLQQAHRALTPEEFLFNGGNELDDAHYIVRVVKALNRLFNLVGVDVQEWYNTTPRRKLLGKPGQQTDTTRVRVDQHFGSLTCPVCGGKKPSTAKLCSDCMADPVGTNLTAQTRRKRIEERVQAVASVCATCTSLPASEVGACDSIDCPTLYSRIKVNRELEDVSAIFADVEKVSQKQKDPYIIL